MSWPEGILSAGIACGIKSGGELDLGVITGPGPLTWAGSFTRNAAAAAPVTWSRSLARRDVRALVVNSGNANACTGAAGMEAVAATTAAVADAIGCSRDEVLVASTGPIGVPLPVGKIVTAVPDAVAALGHDEGSFARSILTTDTHTKTASVTVDDVVVAGVAKGAAMLAPNMATMLAFIATDAALDASLLQDACSYAVERSFNRISVDSCESTNDSVFLLSTGDRSVEPSRFGEALASVCVDLAEQMVRDAEGGSRVVSVEISGADDEQTAYRLARAVAGSNLWRAAVYGADPNWGRIVSALGSAERGLDLHALEVAIGSEIVFKNGEPVGSLAAAATAMAAAEFTVRCHVGQGPESVRFLTTDLSPEYVTLNATGTS